VRTEIERRLGSAVVDATSQPGGFSPGLASRLRTADGRRVFVKACSSRANPDSPFIHRREARVMAALPTTAPAPRFHWCHDDGEWVVLAFDDVEGSQPRIPWRSDELDRVLRLLLDLADRLTPAPPGIESAAEQLAPVFNQWRALAAHDADAARLPPARRARLDALVALELRALDAAAGDTLAHVDIRADNILLTDTRDYIVDWPWAAVGAPWLDLVLFLPSVAMQGGPDPDEIWRAHPLARRVDDDALDAVLAGFAGFLTRQSLQPPAPGLPTIRAFQAAQAETAYDWLARRRGWT
jgi:aminoglycoside phosphotransferase (APT) family kinase protein